MAPDPVPPSAVILALFGSPLPRQMTGLEAVDNVLDPSGHDVPEID